MRGFIVTFCIALGIVGAVVAFNNGGEYPNTHDNVTLAKTYVQTDSANRILSELTMICENGAWVEKYKKVYSYTDGRVFDLSYKFENGRWNQISNTVRTYQDNSLLSKVSYTLQSVDSLWIEGDSQSYADLSFEPENIFCDVVYDKYGNLLEESVYEWANDTRGKGLSKEEFDYTPTGEMSKRTSYVWQNDGWQKEMIADLHYVGNSRLATNRRR